MPSTIPCKSCKSKVLIGDLKADKTGSGWVCFNCYQQQHPEIYPPDKKEERRQILKPSMPEKLKYYCEDCGYKFSREPNFTGKCPYCNRLNIKRQRDAESLIKESTKLDIFFDE